MAKRFAVMEFTSRSGRRRRRGMKRLPATRRSSVPSAAALFAKRTHASCDARPVAQSKAGRRPNVRIIDEGEKMCVERSCMTGKTGRKTNETARIRSCAALTALIGLI
jgi:hypothetical protein